jgi:hypothetical protein
MLKLGGLIVAAVIAAGVLIPSTSYPPIVSGWNEHQTPIDNTSKKQQNAAANQRGTEGSPFFVKILPAKIPESRTADDATQHNNESSHDWWIIVPTNLLALFTAGLFLYTAKLWRSTSQLIREEREASQRALRAYIYLRVEAVPWPPAPQQPTLYSIRLHVTNGGKTWARNVRMFRAMISNAPGDPFDHLPHTTNEAPATVYGPGQTLGLQFADIPLADCPAIHAGTTTRDLAVWVTYEDSVSSPPVIWQTRLSQRVNVDAGNGISFTYRDTHNCADGDCPN